MTALNIASAAVYTKGFALKEKIQIYGMAAIFLALLYNAPSALVIYWTCNNLYSLVKNIVQKNKAAQKILLALAVCASAALIFFVLFMHEGALKKRIIISCAALALWGVILARKKIYGFIKQMKEKYALDGGENACAKIYILACAGIALLAGFVLPSRLIASSVGEFSFIEPFASPLPFVGITSAQAAGFFLWAIAVFTLLAKKHKTVFAFCACVIFCGAVLNTYLFAQDYGFMTPNLQLWGFHQSARFESAVNIAVLLCAFAVIVFIFLKKREAFFAPAFGVCCAVFIALGAMDCVKIIRNFSNKTPPASASLDKKYTFSKTGKNVLLIMLDRAISGYVPFIFEEKPELANSFTGWTFYPNCISFGNTTILGEPGIFGGYEYTPLENNKRTNELWWNKYYEAMQVTPRIFANNNFKVTVERQANMDGALYDDCENITYKKVDYYYTEKFIANHKDIATINYYTLLPQNLIRFSFFNYTPLFLRPFVYDNNKYLSLSLPLEKSIYYNKRTIREFASLYYLPSLTNIVDKKENYATLLVNELTHEPAFFQAPDYTPAAKITNKGTGIFANEEHYHVNISAFLLLAKWFDFLKANGVYDNTRIIIVSDHGLGISSPFPDNIILPNGLCLETYNALLMVKDFNAEGQLFVNNDFMTNADTPALLMRGIIDGAKNPFTGKTLAPEKADGVTIATSSLWEPEKQEKYRYAIKSDEWLHVRDNIFHPENWTKTYPFGK